MKKILTILTIISLLFILAGCIEEKADKSKFYGTWFPYDIESKNGYLFERNGDVYRVFIINGEFYYGYYDCKWAVDEYIFVLCNERFNYKFEGNKLYLYDFKNNDNDMCYIKVK